MYFNQKLEWESLSIDLLPHPDMFSDAHFASAQDGSNKKDDDGAKRVFFGGERFVEGISGQAYVMQIWCLKLILIELRFLLETSLMLGAFTKF